MSYSPPPRWHSTSGATSYTNIQAHAVARSTLPGHQMNIWRDTGPLPFCIELEKCPHSTRSQTVIPPSAIPSTPRLPSMAAMSCLYTSDVT